MCTNTYDAQADNSLLWNDPKINIKWPIADPILSDKDKNALTLEHFNIDSLPTY